MNVSPLFSASTVQYARPAPSNQQLQQELKGLGDSLASGEMGAAQKFFDSFKKLNPSLFTSSASQTQLGQDLASLGNALDSQDLKGAREAFALVKKDMSAVQWAEDAALSARTTAKMLKMVTFETDTTTSLNSDGAQNRWSSISAYA